MIRDFSKACYNNVVVKITSACNLSCRYCYVQSHEKSQAPMTEDVLEAIFDKYSAYAETLVPERRVMYYIWHGGEPLTCGLDYFKQLLAIQARFSHRDCFTYNGIQTNGTLLDSEWVDFLQENSFSLGLSLDGPRLVHLASRRGRQGDSFAATRRSIELLKKVGMSFSIAAVVTDEVASKWSDIYSFFRELDVRYVDFLPCYSPHADTFLTPESFEAFYVPLLRRWLADDPEARPEIRFFSDLLRRLRATDVSRAFEPSDSCNHLGCEVMGRCGDVQYITEKGDLYPCTVLPVNSHTRMGNLVRDKLSECFTSDSFRRFQRAYNRPSRCDGCLYFNICRGGCAARRLHPPPSRRAVGVDYYCGQRQKLIDILVDYLEEAVTTQS
jgi:uncharacterized protein